VMEKADERGTGLGSLKRALFSSSFHLQVIENRSNYCCEHALGENHVKTYSSFKT